MLEPLYVMIIAVIGIIIAIGIGIEMSKDIEDFTIYLLFWLLYIVTIITFINIILVINYYVTMKNKTGPPGTKGDIGETGERGNAGICDPKCRDSICETQITNSIITKLSSLNSSGAVKLNNIYIKSKVAQMCSSDEFKQMVPYNGPMNLINYLQDIWSLWIDLIYDAGGIKYFENVGDESNFDWISSEPNSDIHNPFDELKKYDVFYWGMGKQYRPQAIDSCYRSSDGTNPDTELDKLGNIIRTSNTNLYDFLGNDRDQQSSYRVSFWRARQNTYKGAVFYPIGDLAFGPDRLNENISISRYVGSVNFPSPMPGPNRETILVSGDVKGPVSYELVWKNPNNIFWLWRPIAPSGYISLGDVVTFDKNPPLTGESAPIRCVPLYITIRKQPNGNTLWSSFGMQTYNNALILGFTPNDGKFVSASETNCYNMFRTVIGISARIPDSDINAGFYYLDKSKYDFNFVIGNVNPVVPSLNIDDNKVGKGYMPTPQKDSKYSVMVYLNLKNNATLTHSMTNNILNATLIQNAISNAYNISIDISSNGTSIKCLNTDNNVVTLANCDETNTSQIFSIIFTGNKKNECKLQHYETKNIINYKDNIFTLVSPTEQNDIEYQLFILS